MTRIEPFQCVASNERERLRPSRFFRCPFAGYYLRRSIGIACICLVFLGSVNSVAGSGPSRGLDADEKKPSPVAKSDKESSEKKKDEDEKKKKEKEEDRYLAVIGGTVHTVTGSVHHGVTILTKNGKIVEIAEKVALPEGAETLDASGNHVYPGLVAVDSGGLLSGSSPGDSTNVYSLQMAIALAGGITTVASGNSAGKLTFGSVDDLVVKRDLFHKLSYDAASPKERYELRQKFEKVRQYIRELESYDEEKKLDPDAEEPDKEWLDGEYKKLLKLLRREVTASIAANSASEILAVCELATRYGFDLIVRGAVEGWTVAPQMARAGVSAIVSPRRRVRSDDRLNRPNGSTIENARIMHDHGVPIAIIPANTSITLWGLAGRDLLHLNMEAAFAVRGGLSDDAALRSITIDAARLLGIDHRVGSIEVGKDADFAITDGPILHYMTHTRWAVVNGRIAYDKQKDTLYNHIRPNGDMDAPPPDDYWPRSLGDSQ